MRLETSIPNSSELLMPLSPWLEEFASCFVDLASEYVKYEAFGLD